MRALYIMNDIPNVVNPIINVTKMSTPAPFPEAILFKTNLVMVGPNIKTRTAFPKNIHNQKTSSNRIASGITANTKPLIQGIAERTGFII